MAQVDLGASLERVTPDYAASRDFNADSARAFLTSLFLSDLGECQPPFVARATSVGDTWPLFDLLASAAEDTMLARNLAASGFM